MAVGIAFLRRRADGAWEGDYISVGRGTFWEFQELILSQPGAFLLPAFREEEYDVELSEGPPPYPAQVTPELAEDLESWLQYEAPRLLDTLRRIPADQWRNTLVHSSPWWRSGLPRGMRSWFHIEPGFLAPLPGTMERNYRPRRGNRSVPAAVL